MPLTQSSLVTLMVAIIQSNASVDTYENKLRYAAQAIEAVAEPYPKLELDSDVLTFYQDRLYYQGKVSDKLPNSVAQAFLHLVNEEKSFVLSTEESTHRPAISKLRRVLYDLTLNYKLVLKEDRHYVWNPEVKTQVLKDEDSKT